MSFHFKNEAQKSLVLHSHHNIMQRNAGRRTEALVAPLIGSWSFVTPDDGAAGDMVQLVDFQLTNFNGNNFHLLRRATQFLYFIRHNFPLCASCDALL
jgi:hypothetical protein